MGAGKVAAGEGQAVLGANVDYYSVLKLAAALEFEDPADYLAPLVYD